MGSQRRKFIVLPILLLSAVLLAGLTPGCGGDDSTSPEPGPTPLITGTIDDGGGELIHEEVTLTIPDGALDEAADLAVYSEIDGHPFAENGIPVYRITGLPSDLNRPLTLRIHHGLVLAIDDSLSFFLGEEREAYSGGGGLSWHAVAGTDSSGWLIAELERGALDLGKKADDGTVTATVASKLKWLGTDHDHFELGYNPAEVGRAEADLALRDFDRAYEALVDWGFRFGDDDSIWPLDIYIRVPVKSIACYVAAPKGKGYFEIHPDLLQPGLTLLPVIAHEVFHSVQTFYDPRDPKEWGKLNQERLWLDEATAAYFEVISNLNEGVFPLGMDEENYKALLSGIAGHEELSKIEYGYGMSAFIRYLVEEGNPNDGEEHLLELYRHFATGGDVTDAIDEVVTPSVASWCVDMHRQWAENKIFPTMGAVWFWYGWPLDVMFDSAVGSTASTTATIKDLGAGFCKLFLEGETPTSLTSLMVKAGQADAEAGHEQLPVTVYGRAPNSPLALIATGTDSLNISGWPQLHETYKDIVVMVSRPFSTASGHEGSREIEIETEVMLDLSAVDVASFNGVTIELQANAVFNDGTSRENYRIATMNDVSWTGSGFFAIGNDDTFHIQVDPETLVLGTWYGYKQGYTIGGNYYRRRTGGSGIPLLTIEENSLVYCLEGSPVCQHLTHFFGSEAAASNTVPYRFVTSHSCIDGEYPWTRSGIYVHLFRRE